MGDRLEVYRWHRQYAKKWTEPRPAPLEMSDKEVLDFADEYADVIQQVPATDIFPRRFVIKIEGMDTVRAESLREAVYLAAAQFKGQP